MGKMGKREKIIQSVKSIVVFTVLILVYWFAVGRLIEGNGGLFIVGFFIFLLLIWLGRIWFRIDKISPAFKNHWPEYLEKDPQDKIGFIVETLLVILVSIALGLITVGDRIKINNAPVEIIFLALIIIIVLLTTSLGLRILYNFFFKNIPFIPIAPFRRSTQPLAYRKWLLFFLNKPMQYILIGATFFGLSAIIYIMIMMLIVEIF